MTQEQTTLQDHLEAYEALLLFQETSEEELIDLDSQLPSDVHLVRYELDGEVCVDAIRAYRMSDIFDGLYDRGAAVLEITSGFGRIKPKLYRGDQVDRASGEEG